MSAEREVEWEVERDDYIQRASRGLPVKCVDGRLTRLDPPDRDGSTGETDIGTCPECEGTGCIQCKRCGVVLPDADSAEGCEDPDCGMRP